MYMYMYVSMYTVEPLNNGYIIGTDHIERWSSFGGKNVLPLYRLVC